ncbi:MAG: hypothetical protein R3C02_07710 [Planctomycetaceae bacterium]
MGGTSCRRERLANSLLIDIARFRVMDFETGKKTAHYVAWVIPPAGEEVRIVDLGRRR